MPRPRSPVVSNRENLEGGIETFLDGIGRIAKSVPVPGLAPAVEAIEGILSSLEAVKNNKDAFNALASKIRTMTDAIFQACKEKAAQDGALDRLARHIATYADVLADVQWLIQAHIQRGWLGRYLTRSSDKRKISAYDVQLRLAHDAFMTSSMIGIGHGVSRLEGAVVRPNLPQKFGGAKISGENVTCTKISGNQNINTDNRIDNRVNCNNQKVVFSNPSAAGLPAGMMNIPGLPKSFLTNMNPQRPMYSPAMIGQNSPLSPNQVARAQLCY